MKKDNILDYSTEIPANRTIATIQSMLIEFDAEQILIDSEKGEVKSISFRINTKYGLKAFRIPANTEAVFNVLRSKRKVRLYDSAAKVKDWQKANMIAWRIALDWLEVTFALVKMGMATIDETMMPYMIGKDGHTFYQNYIENQKAIPQNCVQDGQ